MAARRLGPSSADHPSAGGLYAFRTAPLSDFAARETGRHAAFKVLGATNDYIVVAVLDGVWKDPPSLAQVSQASILREHRFAFQGTPAVFGIPVAWGIEGDLLDLTHLGQAGVSREENALVTPIIGRAAGSRYGSMNSANHAAEGEWRWANDRDARVAEVALAQERAEANRVAQEERYRNRLSKLTWEQLLSETPFTRWTPSPPYPSEAFTQAARDTIHQTCRALRDLGPKPRKAEVRALLKGCVKWFNHADDREDGVIETEEREDICEVLEEMAYVARQKSLVHEIDDWRTW